MATGTIRYLDNVTDLPITATAGSGVTIRSFNFHKIGRIVFGYIYFDVTSALSDNSLIATLSSGLPELYDPYATAAVCSSGSVGMVYIGKARNAIKTWGPISTGTENYAQFVYVAR